MPKIRFGKYAFELPRNRIVRISLGVALVIVGGLFGFLPLIGYWMVPLGLIILATDIPIIRRWNRRMAVAIVGWWKGRKSKRKPAM